LIYSSGNFPSFKESKLNMYRKLVFTGLVLLVFSSPMMAFGKKTINEKETRVLALVGEASITLEEFNQELAGMHRSQAESRNPAEAQRGKTNFPEVLKRLIDTKLILMEAENIGIPQLPEVQEAIDSHAKNQLMSRTANYLVKDVSPDPQEVEKTYQHLAREAKIRSLIFKNEKKARDAAKKIALGAAFEDIAAEAIEDKSAEGDIEGHFLSRAELLPSIEEAVNRMGIGDLSPVITVPQGYALFVIEELRYPENPELRSEAEDKVLARARLNSLDQVREQLRDRYAVIHEKEFAALDFDAGTVSVQDLLKNERVVAEITPPAGQGGVEKITVGDFTRILQKEFYHGLDKAMEEDRANISKKRVLYEHLDKKILLLEGRRLGLDRDAEYLSRLDQNRKGVIFGKFLSMVIVPGINVQEGDIRKEYEKNIETYSTPRMLQLQSVLFDGPDAAREALEKFNRGTDYRWLRANAEGRVTGELEENVLQFSGSIVTEKSLPEAVRAALAGAQRGDARIFKGAGKYTYLLLLERIIPSEPMSFEEAKGNIRKKIFGEELQKALEEYTKELRKHYKVKILDPTLKTISTK